MNYLIYVERDAENLQFFLWHKDYVKRFNAASTSDIALSKEWTQPMEDEIVARIQKELAEKLRGGSNHDTAAADIFKGSDFDPRNEVVFPREPKDPFCTPPRSAGGLDTESEYAASNALTGRTYVSEAFAAAGAKTPCMRSLTDRPLCSLIDPVQLTRILVSIQPFRAEIDRVIATYIVDGAPRQLNLSSREQKIMMQALAYTTHPSAFRMVARSVESTLRQQSHPNFIRWSICNGNPPRVFFARALGVGTILLSLVGAIVLTLSRAGRGYRAVVAVGWVLGIATLIAAWKGMCVVLHGMHHRHVRPWELFDTDDEFETRTARSFDSLGSANSYEDEPWIIKYEKRNVVRKVFDREIWIQEPALRQIQDTIFVQSMLAALFLAGLLTLLFVLLPSGGFF